MSLDNGTGEICPPSTKYVPTSRRNAAKDRVRKWKRNRAKWLALRNDSFHGERYADLLEAGHARPFELGGDVEHVLRAVLSRHAVLLLRHLFAMERGFGGNRGGARLSHATSARLLRCSQRTAGAAMRELQALGLVEARWHFRALTDTERASLQVADKALRVRKHQELTPSYGTTARAREFCGRRDRRIARGYQVGKNNQPGRIQDPLRGSRKGAPGRGRPEQAFVSEVRRARQGKTADPVPVARVIMRLPDGRVALAPPLRPGVGRLANARVATPPPSSERAFEARLAEDPIAAFAALCPGVWAQLEADERGGGKAS